MCGRGWRGLVRVPALIISSPALCAAWAGGLQFLAIYVGCIWYLSLIMDACFFNIYAFLAVVETIICASLSAPHMRAPAARS